MKIVRVSLRLFRLSHLVAPNGVPFVGERVELHVDLRSKSGQARSMVSVSHAVCYLTKQLIGSRFVCFGRKLMGMGLFKNIL